MNVYVTVDSKWGIGYNSNLLIQIPRSQKLFQEETEGKVLVMGRKTFEIMFKGQPLPGRTNIILSGNQDFQAKGALVVHSLEELLKELRQYAGEDINVVGGESVFEQLLPYCDVVHVVKLDYTYEINKHFPNLDKNPDWKLIASSDELTYFDVAYEFLCYTRVSAAKSIC